MNKKQNYAQHLLLGEPFSYTVNSSYTKKDRNLTGSFVEWTIGTIKFLVSASWSQFWMTLYKIFLLRVLKDIFFTWDSHWNTKGKEMESEIRTVAPSCQLDRVYSYGRTKPFDSLSFCNPYTIKGPNIEVLMRIKVVH